MSPSEQKTYLMMYKAQIERELAQLRAMLLEHESKVLPEHITGNLLYNASEDYIKALQSAINANSTYLQRINQKLKEVE